MRCAALQIVLSVVAMAIVIAGLAAPAGAAEAHQAAGPLRTVTPEPTDAIRANPGMGWETFHHTGADDRNLPAWIPSTVHYARWGWGTLEPREGEIDYPFLDDILRETRRSGQRLGFRVMCCATTPQRPYQPAWLGDVGARILKVRYKNGPTLTIPDLDDPAVLDRHLDFIARLGHRYDGHPDIDHIDLGTVGWWGEWHMSGTDGAKMPTAANQRRIVDVYLAAFKKTPLVMLIGGGEMFRYATRHGTGWRADCLGDMGGFGKNWCHMRMAYPTMLPKAGALETWKTAPVAWETCWDLRKWVAEGWSLRFIFNYALALHGSYLNNKSAPLPAGPEVRQEVERFLKRLGYRLVLKQLEHPSRAAAGDVLPLTMQWQNTGSAPCYRLYRLAYRLSNDKSAAIKLVGGVTAERWLPGSIELFTEEFFKQPNDLPPGPIVSVTDRITLPADLSPGTYTLSIGLVEPAGARPVIQLGIRGRNQDGWYPLSKLDVR
jgi:hypothetical protein